MSLLDFMGEALAALWRERHYDAEAVARLQRLRLRALVAHAQRNVPLYRALYAGVDPVRFQNDELPSVDKATLMARLGDSLADRRLDPEALLNGAAQSTTGQAPLPYVVTRTSGTSGAVGCFVISRRDWARQIGVLFARVLRERLTLPRVLRFGPWRRYRMAFLVATGGPYATYLVSQFHSPVVQVAARLRALSILEPLAETAARLHQDQPHFLHGYTSYVTALARAQLAGQLSIRPEVVSLSSEPVSDDARAILARAFPEAEIRETYAATESLCIANTCHLGRLHLNEDVCVLETVDARGVAVPAGAASSKVLITNLLCWTQPIIRYEMPDRVVIEAEPCPCGAPFRTIRVRGRSDDVIYLRTAAGAFAPHPPIPFELLFLEVEGVASYQLVHTRQNELLVRYVPASGQAHAVVTPRIVRAFDTYLQGHGLERAVEVRIEPVAKIERDPASQKLRQIYSLVPPPDAEELRT